MHQQLAYFDRCPDVAEGFRTGVSLHSHTLHSKENALPLGKFLQSFPVVRELVGQAHKRYGTRPLDDDLARMWWTPPLSAREALDLEARQIEDQFGLAPIVSISDHDSIDASMQLQILQRDGAIPVSVEWSVPFRDTYFHVGIHNLPSSTAVSSMNAMAAYTADPRPRVLAEMLAAFHADPGCLIVLNHPYWDQPTIGEELHEERLAEFTDRFQPWIHALEINGLRDWRENQRTVVLSRRSGAPLISGGDRHGREPNAVLNLTNATSFAEFASEVRSGISRVILLPQYRRPLALRIIENFTDIVSDAPEHGLGWTSWTQRVFRQCDDGTVRSLHAMCGEKPPAMLRAVTAAFRMLSHRYVKPALEWAMPPTRELV